MAGARDDGEQQVAGYGEKSIMKSATARLLESRLLPILALLCLLAGCFPPSKNTVLLHENISARLATKKERYSYEENKG